MTANTNSQISSAHPNRREFSRRNASMSGRLSMTTDFSESWGVKITNISLTGMFLAGKIPQFSPGTLYVRLDGIDVTIAALFIAQDRAGLRIKIGLDELQLTELVMHSEIYTSLVLEAIPDSPRTRSKA